MKVQTEIYILSVLIWPNLDLGTDVGPTTIGIFECPTPCHFVNQILKLNDLKKYDPLKIFKSNVTVGLILTIASLGNYINFMQ